MFFSRPHFGHSWSGLPWTHLQFFFSILKLLVLHFGKDIVLLLGYLYSILNNVICRRCKGSQVKQRFSWFSAGFLTKCAIFSLKHKCWPHCVYAFLCWFIPLLRGSLHYSSHWQESTQINYIMHWIHFHNVWRYCYSVLVFIEKQCHLALYCIACFLLTLCKSLMWMYLKKKVALLMKSSLAHSVPAVSDQTAAWSRDLD